MSNASDPLQNNRKAFFIYIIMELSELKDKRKDLEFNIYSLILDFIKETKVSDIDLTLRIDKIIENGSGLEVAKEITVKINLNI